MNLVTPVSTKRQQKIARITNVTIPYLPPPELQMFQYQSYRQQIA
jgi:hypothetical protein